MKLNRIVEILLTEFDMMEGGDFETAIKLQNSALKIHTELEQEKNNVVKSNANPQSELLRGDYRPHFLEWKTKFFEYAPKTYEYKSFGSKDRFTLDQLKKRYIKAMNQSPFDWG